MLMNSVSDCLNFIDSMIFYIIEKRDSIEDLDNVRDYFLDCYNDENNEELLAILPISYQISLIIDRFYVPNDYIITDLYQELRECILNWLKDCCTEKAANLNENKTRIS